MVITEACPILMAYITPPGSSPSPNFSPSSIKGEPCTATWPSGRRLTRCLPLLLPSAPAWIPKAASGLPPCLWLSWPTPPPDH